MTPKNFRGLKEVESRRPRTGSTEAHGVEWPLSEHSVRRRRFAPCPQVRRAAARAAYFAGERL